MKSNTPARLVALVVFLLAISATVFFLQKRSQESHKIEKTREFVDSVGSKEKASFDEDTGIVILKGSKSEVEDMVKDLESEVGK